MGEQCPWPWSFVGKLTELCIFVLFSLCCALFLGEEVEEGNLQCVAHTSYSLYYKQIFSLLHLNFCSVYGVNSSLPACICEAKRVTGWQWSNACPRGRFFLKSLYGLLSPHITGRKKIGGFQRLTSVLWWWLTAMGTRRKGGLGEEWDWRRLLFQGRESDSPESAGVWLCYSRCFLAWFESPFACTELPWS